MLKSEAAAYLAGVTQTEGAEASAPTNLHVITGEVGEASADGKTLVKIDGLMFSESDDQFIEVDALGGLEEGDIATIVLTGEQGHAMTPLALGSIGSVDRITVRIAAIEADYIKVDQLEAAEARIGDLEADHVSTDDLDAATARIGTLETTRATIADLEAATARIHSLEVDHVTVDNFEAATARIGDLESDHVSTDDLDAATARIGTLETNTADIGTIRANSAKVQNLTAAELEADHATVGSLDTNYAHITNGVIDNATIGYADVNNLSAHYAEIQNGKINSALIDTAAIVDEQVFTVTGNKATLAQIDASKINVLNLKAKDIEVERINGQPVTNKTLVDALSQHETDISGLDTKIDNEVEALNDRIDGAIETFTGTAVPTLSNTPASQWNTVKLKDQHVGDVYYVVNSQSAQNGYCYRFTKSGSTYSWQLIKDSDVTAALSRLQTAEGKISSIEQFDVTVGSFMTDTDDELSSLKTRTTSLETSMGDKVDTSTFNTVSQKVDENSASISTLSETVSTKADSSTVTTLSNTVNTVKQTADTNKASITSLTQTVNNKADGTTVTTLTNRVSTVEQNLSGITTRVGKTEQSIESVANPNLTPYFSADPTDVYNATTNPHGYWHVALDAISGNWTQLEDGWARLSKDNSSGTGPAYGNVRTEQISTLKPNTDYTLMVEARNVTVSGTVYLRGIAARSGTGQFASSPSQTLTTVSSAVFYQHAKTLADLSGCRESTSGYIQIAAGASITGDFRFSLYESAVVDIDGTQTIVPYDGPYKPYVEQTLIARMRSAETSIEQNAEDITLRATKAEFNALSIGGRNFLISSEAERVVSLTSATGTSFYTEYINESEYGKSITNGNVDDIFVLSFDWTTTSADGVAWVQVDGNIIANPIDGNGGTSDGSRGKNYLDLGYGSGRYWVAFKYTSTQAGKAQQRIRIRISGAEVSTKPLTANSTFSASHFKLEKGTRPTDWTPAPEDMASQTDLTEAKAAIKVTTDGISSTVEKIRGVKYLKSPSSGASLANIQRYSAEGNTDTWAVTSGTTSDLRAGDTIYLQYKDTTRNCYVYIKGTVNSFSNSNVNFTAHGYEDVLPVATVISTINQSAETVKIQASKVEIDGTAVFNAAKSKLDAAYDAKGAAASLVSGGENLVGRFNLNVNYNCSYDYTTGTMTSTTTTNTADSGVYLQLYNGSSYVRALANNFGTADVGKVCGWTLEKASDFDAIKLKFNGNKADSEVRWNVSSIPDGTTITLSFYLESLSSDGKGNGGVLRGINLRTGNMFSEWSLAPQDETIGGRNLLTGTDMWLTTFNGYSSCGKGSETIPAGSVVTVSVEVDADNLAWDTESNTHRIGFETSLTKTGGGSQYFGVWAGNAISESLNVVEVFTGSIHKRIAKTFTLLGDFVLDRAGYIYTQGVAQGTVKVGRPKIEYGNRATDWSPAPEDIEANAVKRTQRIYYRSSASTAPATMPTAWVTETGNKWAGNNSTVANWSTKVTPIANGTGATATKYLYLWTCEQREMANGTLAYTNVLLDDSTTVIDGGNIITNSITANQIAANAVTADKLAANSLTIGKFTDADKAKVDNSYVQVGGRNLLLWTANLPKGSDNTVSGKDGIAAWGNALGQLVETDEGIRLNATGNSTECIGIPLANNGSVGNNENVLLTFEARGNITSIGQFFWLQASGANVGFTKWLNGNQTISLSETSWTKFTTNVKHAQANIRTCTRILIFYGLGSDNNGKWVEIRKGTLKLEKGNKPTDWSPAPEDMATNSSVDQTYVQNLTPYFLTDMTKTSDEYWANLTYARFTRLGDGWAHFEYTNSGTKTADNYIKLKLLDFLEPGGKYTLLAEFKNVSISAGGGSFYSQQGSDVQVWGAAEFCGFAITNAEIRALSGGAGAFYKTLTLLTADSKDPSGTVRGSLPKSSFMSINQQVQAGQTVSYDLRLSLYADGYTGTYKPYVGSQLYATGKSLSDSQDFLDERIDSLDDRTTNAENSLETTSEGLEKAVKDIASLNKKYTDEKALRDQWMDFTRSEGLVIGDNESTFKTVIGSESMEFKNGDITLAKASGTEFGADVMRSEELHIGKWMWTKRNEGNNLSLKWVG